MKVINKSADDVTIELNDDELIYIYRLLDMLYVLDELNDQEEFTGWDWNDVIVFASHFECFFSTYAYIIENYIKFK